MAAPEGATKQLARIPDISKTTLHAFISRNIKDETETIYTEEFRSYLGIEGAWSLFQRSIVAAFHKISTKHLDRYLEEMEWRFKNRNNPFTCSETP